MEWFWLGVYDLGGNVGLRKMSVQDWSHGKSQLRVSGFRRM